MKFQEIVDQVKAEGRVKADASFDAVVINLINELFKEAVESQRPPELRQELDLPIVQATGIATVPENFLIHHQIFFRDVDTGKLWLLPDEDAATQPAPRGMYGHPKSSEVVSGTISVKPTTSLVNGDTVHLVYYKLPPVLTAANLNTENPIVRLEPFLVRAAIRRIRMLHIDDPQVATMFEKDISSAASGYSHDEPERTT